jgi:hypothetical protein
MNQTLAGSPSDVSPFLNQKIIDYHYQNNLTPIVIYPETFDVSKFNAPYRVRYVLNYDQLFSANKPLASDDYVLAYSKKILDGLEFEGYKGVIFLPVSDPNFYFPPPSKIVKRSGGIFYAGKFKYHFEGKTFDITDGMPEITRDQPSSQTPEEIRNFFHKAEFFYCYEDSALAIEAILCGCPVVFLPNEYFKEPLGAKELKGLGYAWDNAPEQLAHAKATVSQARARYLELLDEADKAVKEFVEETQKLVSGVEYKVPFASRYIRNPSRIQIFLDYLRFLHEVIEDNGLKKTLKIIFKRLRARRFKIY